MNTTTSTTKVKLSCHHVQPIDGPVEVGDKVDCDRCSADKPSPRSRRVKAITGPLTETTVTPAELVEGITDVGRNVVAAADNRPSPETLAKAEAAQAAGGYDVVAARDEWKALKAWETAGKKGDRPSTANLDAMNAAHAAGKPRSGRKAKVANRRPTKAAGLVFVRNGHVLNKHNQSLSAVAWQSTKGLGADGGRLSTAALRALLAENGVTEPESGPWELTLANGITISAAIQ